MLTGSLQGQQQPFQEVLRPQPRFWQARLTILSVTSPRHQQADLHCQRFQGTDSCSHMSTFENTERSVAGLRSSPGPWVRWFSARWLLHPPLQHPPLNTPLLAANPMQMPRFCNSRTLCRPLGQLAAQRLLHNPAISSRWHQYLAKTWPSKAVRSFSAQSNRQQKVGCQSSSASPAMRNGRTRGRMLPTTITAPESCEEKETARNQVPPQHPSSPMLSAASPSPITSVLAGLWKPLLSKYFQALGDCIPEQHPTPHLHLHAERFLPELCTDPLCTEVTHADRLASPPGCAFQRGSSFAGGLDGDHDRSQQSSGSPELTRPNQAI
mmetsp:Transcript_25413/g.59003  ORF Transcript_25413/g.59003 Transcript_25413/m.59003 type:complete len:324 (-) Transcript_25413:81-1052(-)